MITIVLPFPNSKLNPNNIQHFHVKAKIKADARMTGFLLTKGIEHNLTTEDRLKVEYTCHRKDKRPVDLDNILASTKSVADGVFDALKLNDNQIDSITIVRGEVDKCNSRVVMKISKLY